MSDKFVIQEKLLLPSKARPGETFEMVSYFQTFVVGSIGCYTRLTGKPEEAKQYDTATEAHREKRKYFKLRKGVKVINLKTLQHG